MTTRRTVTGLRLTIGAMGALAVLSACGGGDDFADGSAADIEKAFKTDMESLTSVHIAGDLTSGGQEIALDLALNDAGDCVGSIGIGEGTAEIISADGQSWIRPDEAFWRAQAADAADQIIEAAGSKWVVVPAGESSFTSVCDLDEIVGQLTSGEKSEAKKDGTGDVDGEPAVKLSREDSEDPDATGTAWIAVEGKHYLLQFDKVGGDEAGSVKLTDFDEEISAEAPADDEVVDLESVG